MKLTKDLKTELAKAYQCAMEVSLLDMKAPLRYVNQYIAENVSGYGTAADEKIQSREGFRRMVMAARQQSKGIAFTAKIITPYRPKFIDETTAHFREEIVVQIGDKKNKHALYLWFSTLFKYQHNKWQMVMFHGSVPDAASSTNDTFHVKEAEKKLKELELIVEQRTADLKTKTRELEIEASLERVRTVAMGMHKADDLLGICEVLFAEFHKMKFSDLRNAMINIYNDEQGFFLNYDFSGGVGASITKFPSYDCHPVIENITKQIRSASDSFAEITLTGKELKSWKEFRKQNGELPDLNLGKSDVLYYYFYSVGTAAVGISTYKAITTEQQEVLKRFRNVFDLAYKRYVDITNAEAQTKEAQIELALERVRAKSLAMHTTSELQEVINTVHQELLRLNIGINGGSFIAINSEIDQELRCWGSGGTAETSAEVHIPHYNKPFYTNLVTRIKKAPSFFTEEFSEKEKKEFFTFLFKHEPWSKLNSKAKKETLASPGGYTRSCSVSRHTSIFIINHFGEKFSEVENDILKRFGKVFEQAYSRFLDLKNAEAQSRETEIELALERIRARTMAMQKSEELKEVIQVLYDQFVHLNIAIDHTGFILDYKERNDMLIWLADKHGVPTPQISIPYFDSPHWNSFLEAKKNGDHLFVNLLDFKTKNKFYKQLFKFIPGIPKDTIDFYQQCPGLAISTVLLDNVGLYIENFDGIPYTDKENDVLMRIGKVFQQTYTRFLDLQKSEAQVRAAQIELGVERVRAKALAMHNSSQILEVVATLKNEMLGLEIPGVSAATIYLEENDFIRMWDLTSMQEQEGELKIALDIKFKLEATHPDFYIRNIWANKQQYFVEKQDVRRIKIAFEWLRQFYPAEADQALQFIKDNAIDHLLHPTVRLENGKMSVDIMNIDPPAEMESIMIKMGAAFDLAYKRFLDLQKSEVRAIESQIQLALERVRARTMAMQKSDELADTAAILFKQLILLGIEPNRLYINIIKDENGASEFWITDEDGSKISSAFESNLNDTPSFKKMFQGWKKNQKSLILDMRGEELAAYFKYLGNLHVPFRDGLTQTRRLQYIAYFNKGFIGMAAPDELPEATMLLLERFAAVFNLTFTRFNDLKIAEAQTREAQIEASLEKVRSRSLAMHKSDELNEVVAVLFGKFKDLQIPATAVGICIPIEGSRDFNAFVCGENEAGLIITNYRLPYFENIIVKDLSKVYDKQMDLFVGNYSHNEKNKFYEYLFQHSAISNVPHDIKNMIFESPTYTITMVSVSNAIFLISDFQENILSEHEIDIIKRFAKVFDQAYTRFLDLQKAEAQAREGQINLAVERVRAKALAMFKSDEILDVVFKLKEEVMGLEIPNVLAATIYLAEKNGAIRIWDLTSMEVSDGSYHQPLDITFNLEQSDTGFFMRRIWNNNEKYFVVIQEEHDLKITLQWLRDNNRVEQAIETEAFINAGHLKKVYHPTVPLENGRMCIDLLEPPSEEIESILTKMAAAFNLAHKRFEDLKNSEEQLKEAQIELSLERIRAKVTAMKVSSDLLDIVVTMRTEFVNLSHEAHYFWHMRWLSDKYEKAMTSGDGTRIGNVMTLPRHMHGDIPVLAQWEKTSEPTFVYTMDEEAAVDYIIKMIELGNFDQVDPNAPTLDDIRHIGGLTFVMARTTHGEIGYSLPGVVKHPPADGVATIVRFASVFDLAYRRFEDLKSSEKQIREAQIELALERVRARSLAMHKSEELGELSLELVKQVQGLGVSTWFCAFNIYDENEPRSLEWGSNGIGTFPTYITPRENIFLKYHDAGQKGETLLINVIGELECPAHYEYLCSLPGIGDQLSAMKTAGIPFPSSQIDHVAFMKYGYLLFITYEPVPEAHEIFIRFATVFEQTYRRFLDLQKAEALAIRAKEDLIAIKEARQNAEAALTELQATQRQLIQSEKMASLGELTAGIAHEIQNPLNFVNNFSEVSTELLDEVLEEAAKGNFEEVKEILNDVKHNLEKINHHGKRADGIVKGMLQHSRSSSGLKEPTDINALTDEYLRLAYHGLRAKDKSFNATLKTDYDNSIGNINIIPQDIGRVILNLITNAFYAVAEKKGIMAEGYEPAISVSTKKLKDKIEISVADNGNGIPQNIIDKIFQPFFTTKPTGQGTGLGLSLSYDIVKAHGGELTVDTKEGERSTFKIYLPQI